MIAEYERILDKSRAKQKEIHRQMQHLAKFSRTGFDATVARYHADVFAKIDCLQCGNCCRQIGPRFRDKDVKILAKEVGLTPKAFIDRYLKPDADIDFYVLEKLPCPYLSEDATCSVYEKRPLSCEEFPYTNTHNIQRHLVRLGHSAMVCPAAALIVERIIAEY
jgi:Fe-S-cluster containining protein